MALPLRGFRVVQRIVGSVVTPSCACKETLHYPAAAKLAAASSDPEGFC